MRAAILLVLDVIILCSSSVVPGNGSFLEHRRYARRFGIAAMRTASRAGSLRCAPSRFGEGGADFFQPEAYKAWADCWHRANPDDRRIHILFEATAKTELGAAFGLMKELPDGTGLLPSIIKFPSVFIVLFCTLTLFYRNILH